MDIWAALVILFGLTVGSFLNVVLSRYGKGSFGGRSFCDHCHATLSWFDLIPIVSFLILRGRCRYCGYAIPLQYPLVEAGTAFLFVFVHSAWQYGFLPPPLRFPFDRSIFEAIVAEVYYFGVGAFLLLIFVFDARSKIIPDFASFFFWIIGIGESLTRSIEAQKIVVFDLAVAGGIAALFFGVWFFTKERGMGFGDVKLAPALVLFLGGLKGIVMILFSFWLGALYGITLLLLGRATRKTAIPFGPFLAIATFIALLFGERIAWYYVSLF